MNNPPIPESVFKDWIRFLGDDPEREGLRDTYLRFVESRQELMSGYKVDPKSLITLFDAEGFDEMIICRDIDFFSTCEHHLLPFSGRAHIGYIPKDSIVGLSKFSRVVDAFAKRMQNQERLTTQIANFFQETLKPQGLGVILEAEHFCIKSRGADKQNSLVTTSAFRGGFKNLPETRAEFLNLIAKAKL
ncbi:MAG: GTP cyclohydrolase I FolE [bacterium]|nr:GTP cyclohydrolase I FolE [bacterium]